jgi:hypothetical protein
MNKSLAFVTLHRSIQNINCYKNENTIITAVCKYVCRINFID